MELISANNIETYNGEYNVELFDITAHVSVYKRRSNGTIYQQQLKFGSARFLDAIKAMVQQSAPGSLTREHLAACECRLVQKLLAKSM